MSVPWQLQIAEIPSFVGRLAFVAQANAEIPVISRPTISACMFSVPS
jgi:hypothetical protein